MSPIEPVTTAGLVAASGYLLAKAKQLTEPSWNRINQEQKEAAQTAFIKDFTDKAKALDHQGLSNMDYERKTKELLAEILHTSRMSNDSLHSTDNNDEFQSRLAFANQLANDGLTQLDSFVKEHRLYQAEIADTTPIIVAKGKDANDGYSLIRPAPLIENLVLSGGGAKGVGIPPMLTVLEHHGRLVNLKEIAGTSAGALVGTLLATGFDAQQLQREYKQLDITTLDKDVEQFETMYPNISINKPAQLLNTGHLWRSAEVALQQLDEMSRRSVRNYLLNINDGAGLSAAQRQMIVDKHGEHGLNRLSTLTTQPEAKHSREPYMVTFADLQLLHDLDACTFKKLTLTGWDKASQKVEYFNADNHPDMPIALAARISMSIPNIFASVNYDDGNGAGEKSFVDGGMGSNTPSEVFMANKTGIELAETRARTAVLAFNNNGDVFDRLHGDDSSRDSALGWWASLLSGNDNLPAAHKHDNTKIYNAGPNARVIMHGDIDTLDLHADEQRKQIAANQSTNATLSYLLNRSNQAYAVDVDNIETAVQLLDDSQRNAVVRAGPPHDKNSSHYQAQLDFYESALRVQSSSHQ